MNRGLTIAQVVEQGPLGRSSVYRAIAEGRLTGRKFGRRTIILEADWAAFLEGLPCIAPQITDSSGPK
jgi:hypothetical protein